MSSRLDPYALVGASFRERFALEGFAGIGRFSAVYRGTEAVTLRPTAISLLKVRPGLTASQRTSLLRRLGMLGSVVQDVAGRCPTLAGVLDVGAIVTPEGRWMPGVVQPWLAGDTLEAVLEWDRHRVAPPRTLAQTILWMTPVADALSCAHASGLVHGSLAPRNVFVRGEASAELLDLGMAAALAELQWKDAAFGAPEEGPISFFVPAYASPEHFTAASAQRGLGVLSPAADVFSLALLMVELLTGGAPLGDGDDAQLEAATRDPVVRPTPRARGRDLGGHVEAIFERALAVRPGDRYGTVESFWSALRTASRLTLRTRASTVPPPIPSAAPPPLPRAATPVTAVTAVTLAATPRALPPPLPEFPPASPPRAPARASSAPPLREALARKEAGSFTPAPSARAAMKSESSDDDAADDLEVGSILAGKYAIERLLGRGGMGAVWLCRHLALGERVAVKVMCRRMAADPEVRARFEREARAAARIKSRYVARVYDTGELPDLRPYIVMEYMEGETLAQALLAAPTMSLADTVRILGQVGRGLARAHELGIVHRDIKPDNIFLAHTADDGVLAKVFDFGIVKVSDTPNDGATRHGVLLGTPHYMSPEQADGLPIDHRSDIYSLGVVAFRMLTGRRPFQGDSVLAVLVKICGAPLPGLAEHAPGVPPAVDAWFRRACARDRGKRFTSAIECVDALASAAGIAAGEGLRDVSILPPPPSRQASAPPDPSGPTLLDDMTGVTDEDGKSDFFWPEPAAMAAPAEMPAARPPFQTNPLFGGERPSIVPGGSMAPQALDASRRPPTRSGAGARSRPSRSILAGVAVAAAVVAIAITPGFSRVASGEGVRTASSPPPPPAPPAPAPAPPLIPPSALSDVAGPVHGVAPVAAPPDAGAPRPQAQPQPRAGRSRRASSAASR